MQIQDDQTAAMHTLIVRGIRESLGLHERFATEAADAVFDKFRAHFGGEMPYMPKRDPRRREKALREFNGRNHDEVCRRYQISRRTLERYVQSDSAER